MIVTEKEQGQVREQAHEEQEREQQRERELGDRAGGGAGGAGVGEARRAGASVIVWEQDQEHVREQAQEE
jgi:hypothetical protein